MLQILRFYILICILSLGIILDVQGQKDSSYVESEKTHRTLGFSTRYRQYNVKTSLLQDINNNPYEITKHDISIGLRIRYKALNLAIIYGIHDLYTDQLYTPGLINVDVKLYPKQFFIKYNLQWGSIQQTIPEILLNIGDAKQDSRIITTSLWTAYLWNHEKISLSSSYSFVEKQKKSAGSWLNSGFTEYNHFSKNPTVDVFENPDPENTFRKMDEFRVGIGGGYTYSWIVGPLVLNGILTTNVELVNRNITLQNDERDSKPTLTINPFLKINGSVMYYFGNSYMAVLLEQYPRSNINSEVYEKRYWWLRFSYGYKF